MHAIFLPNTNENQAVASVASTMAIEAMPLSRREINNLMRVIRGEVTTEQLRRELYTRIHHEKAERMSKDKYCYLGTDILINKLGIKNAKELFFAEKELVSLRLIELQRKPINGKYDFKHLQKIHKYIFQDVYDWAGSIRTVEISKGNMFCPIVNIYNFATDIFSKYYPQCWVARKDLSLFVKMLAKNYGDLNALHPFREGNGRAQREFARIVCLKCGRNFDLSSTTHKLMLDASKTSFITGENTKFEKIFENAVIGNPNCDDRLPRQMRLLRVPSGM